MDINDFLRGFFGFPKMRHPGFEDPFFRRRDEFYDDGNFHGNIENSSDLPDTFSDSMFDDNDFPRMFHPIEDMFNNMFQIHTGFLDFPNLERIPEKNNPRDMMLKELACDTCQESCNGNNQNFNISSDLNERKSVNSNWRISENLTPSFSFHKSFTSRIVKTGDGAVEEHRTVTDSTGKTVTTVKKFIGDKSYTVTTESDKTGVIEKKEDFINLEEKDLAQFEDEFKQKREKKVLPSTANETIVPNESNVRILPRAPPGDSKYSSIFKKFFDS